MNWTVRRILFTSFLFLIVCSTIQAQTPPLTHEQRRELNHQQIRELFENVRERQSTALLSAATRPIAIRPPQHFYIDNVLGDDLNSGTSPEKSSTDGPVQTFKKAISLLGPGDTLHLAVTEKPYREMITLADGFGGLPGLPITIDGHGATLLGCDRLLPEDWEATDTPGLYRCSDFEDKYYRGYGAEALTMRMFFVFDGKVQRMGRSSKGIRAPFKEVKELKPGEWTYQESEKAFYVKVDGTLEDARVEAPYLRGGVEISGNRTAVTNVVIKNLIVCRVVNDGFNIHGTTQNIHLENIAACECGDDGISPHEACQLTIDGFWSIGNSTGMCNTNLSQTIATNVYLQNNFANQLMTMEGPITGLSNTVIVAPAGTCPINHAHCLDVQTALENVEIYSPESERCFVLEDSSLTGRHITSLSPTWDVFGRARLEYSFFGPARILVRGEGTWSGHGNVFDPSVVLPEGERSTVRFNLTHEEDALKAARKAFPSSGATIDITKMPPTPNPHPDAGDISYLLVHDLKPLMK